jgi:hypothetical protein
VRHKEKKLAWQKRYRDANPVLRATAVRQSTEKTKILVLSHYGPNGVLQCNRCDCSDLRALTIDHVEGGGGEHRKELRKNVWFWLKKNEFPEGYQTLCFNHQRIKQFENREFGGGRPKVEGGSERLIRQREAQARFRANNPRVDVQYRQQLKIQVCTHYGYNGELKCAWNGCEWTDIRVLSIDHINGGGTEHRKQIGGGGAVLYGWLIEQGFPNGYQTLCMNHQWIKEAA